MLKSLSFTQFCDNFERFSIFDFPVFSKLILLRHFERKARTSDRLCFESSVLSTRNRTVSCIFKGRVNLAFNASINGILSLRINNLIKDAGFYYYFITIISSLEIVWSFVHSLRLFSNPVYL